MWRHGLRRIGGRLLLGLALLGSLSPGLCWAEPSATEKAALEALSQAEAALAKAQEALTGAGKALAASKEESMGLKEALSALKIEVEKLKGEYATRLTELEALRMQSAELSGSLKASQAETLTADRWAAGLGMAFLLALLGWIFL